MAFMRRSSSSPSVAVVIASSSASVWLSAQGAPPPSGARIRGFSEPASAAEAARERELKALPSAKAAEADFDVMTAEPHHVGSPYEIKLADYIGDSFKDLGFDVSRYEYSVLVPWPKERRIDIVAPDAVKLQVEEDTIPGDPWATKPGILPAYNAYSPSGDVTGEIVYVNFGVPRRLRDNSRSSASTSKAGSFSRGDAAEAGAGIKPKARGRAWRHRLHHLFGSARGRLLPGRRVSRRPVPRLGHDSARQRDGHAEVSRRSVHARSSVEAGRRTSADGQDRDVRRDSGPADVVSRRPRRF